MYYNVRIGELLHPLGAKRVEKYSLDFRARSNTFFEVNFISKFLKNAVAKTIKLFKNRPNILN